MSTLSGVVKIEAMGRRPGRTIWSYRIIGTASVGTVAISFDIELLFPEDEMKKFKKPVVTKTAIRSLPPESIGTVELYVQPRQGWEMVHELFAKVINKYGARKSGPEPSKGLYANWMLTIWEIKGPGFKPLMDELGALCDVGYADIPES